MSITIHGLKVSDSGSYDCALNLKSHVLNVVHTLQIEGEMQNGIITSELHSFSIVKTFKFHPVLSGVFLVDFSDL